VVATFGLLHGAWHDSSCWEPLVECLEAGGHSAIAPELPLHDPEARYEQRARPAIEALAGADGELVVVPHSQSSGLGALVAAALPVTALVYLCPRMGGVKLPDDAPAPFREWFPFPPNLPDGTSAWDPNSARDVMYPRLAPERAQALVDHLQPMAMPPDDFPLEDHPDVPTALIYASEDEFFEPAFERFVAGEVLGLDPIEIPGGHFPMAEDPEALAALLDRLAQHSEWALEIDRKMPAAPEAVFAAFTDPEMLARWWGPAGFEIPHAEVEARPGSRYRIEMLPPEGDSFFLSGTFRRVDPLELLIFTFAWEQPDPDDVDNLVELSFLDLGGSTRVSLRQSPFKTEARWALHREGWTDSFDKLQDLLSR
jgi:uncharacterized protein YndB with AHSA1/START domain/pimeloyl-ACP methyl ester carboxylesterase